MQKANSFKKKQFVQKTKLEEGPTLTDEYKEQICAESYIGKKGYTIPKSALSQQDMGHLMTELNVKPEVPGIQYGPQESGDAMFPVFRENANKIYIPRFYGIQRYGHPLRSELTDGDTVNVAFSKELRDYQKIIVGKYIDHIAVERGNGGILEVPCGRGKTVMALDIISKMKKKTLIIVHKEFLMNQWIERIDEFLPGARVGKIQGQVHDIEDKDIVIGMVQTMYNKPYSSGSFDSFGLTIIDEVHRIGSEQFSQTLCKVLTKNMLGISATVDRKDGLTRVLYMFIGEKIYEEKRESDDPVCVRGIQYVTKDEEFNEVETDYRGNPKFSTMITKLCSYGPRSEFIVRVIGDMLEEHPDNQIMILCHNRSLLTYLHSAVETNKLTTVGYYVGGMKQKDLQETETKQIVLATYAMAAEALDIKTLSTLIMVTPKTDITQSVGRILRVKHHNPLIVDIIDSHGIFQNQWTKRKKFYRQCGYKIHSILSTKYTKMNIDWKNSKEWKCLFDPKKGKTADPEDNNIQKGSCLINIAGL